MERKIKKEGQLYIITDNVEVAEKALSSGADIIQLRDKKSSDRILFEKACIFKELSEKFNAIFIVNDRVDIALASNSDGVHLGQDDLPVDIVRKILGENKIIGLSTHSEKEIINAKGIDYIAVGPIFKSLTKPELSPKGIKLIEKAKKLAKVTFFAIGGINLDNISYVIKAGARNVVISSGILNNIEEKVKKIKEILST